MRYRLLAAMCATVLTTFAPQAAAQVRRPPRPPRPPARDEQVQNKAFEWSGELAQGQRIILRSLNGTVSVEPASGRTLEVIANKKWRRGNPADVRVEATRVNAGRDVLVCATWNASTQCDEKGYQTRGSWNNNNDTQVEFIIKLPAGANALLHTTNGDIDLKGTSGTIEAGTTNGSISAASSDGTVEANTTNGDIEVRLAKVPARGASYHTTNGSITLALPDGCDADIKARTTNGRINSEFSLSVSGPISGRSIRGTIGKGGPLFDLATTNGSIRIEKR